MAYRSVWRLIGVSLDLNMKARSHNVCCLIQPDFISANIMLLYCALCTVRLVLRAVGRGAKSIMSLKQLWESSHSSHSIARESSRNITCSERMMARLTPCSNIALSIVQKAGALGPNEKENSTIHRTKCLLFFKLQLQTNIERKRPCKNSNRACYLYFEAQINIRF